MQKIYKNLIMIVTFMFIITLPVSFLDLTKNVSHAADVAPKQIVPQIDPEHMLHFFRVKHLSNCQSGYAFFAQWANISGSFNKIHGFDNEVLQKSVKEMYVLARKKHVALDQIILKVKSNAITNGVDKDVLNIIGKVEFTNSKIALEKLFLGTALIDSKSVSLFFEGLRLGDVGCQQLVFDILNDNDIEPGYYIPGKPEQQINY